MINAAIVGIGWWGKRIVQAVQGKSLLRFTHGVARQTAGLDVFAKAHSLVLTTDFVAVLRDPAVDAVVLATPHSMHADQVVAAASAGKHVFCEKPLALKHEDAIRAVRACEQHNRVLAVGENKRFWPSMVTLREIVSSGSLGELLHLEAHASNQNSKTFSAWRHLPAESPAGGMTGAGTKLVDGLISIAGPVASVTARQVTRRTGIDPLDSVSAIFTFAGGASGVLSTVRSTPAYSRFHVFGDVASAEVLSETALTLRKPGGKIEHRELAPRDSVLAEMDAFAIAIKSGVPYPITGEQAIDTVAVLEAIVTSIREKETIVLHDDRT